MKYVLPERVLRFDYDQEVRQVRFRSVDVLLHRHVGNGDGSAWSWVTTHLTIL